MNLNVAFLVAITGVVKKDCRVDDGTYRKYCRDYNYDECPIYKHQESSSCFITTVACQILGKEDNDPVLNDFRKFRGNILQKIQNIMIS